MPNADIEWIFRYYRLTEEQREVIKEVFAGALVFARILNTACPDSREKSLAIQSLQSTVHWADTAIALHYHITPETPNA